MKQPEAILYEDAKERIPFECALENAGHSPYGPATIKFLLRKDNHLVNVPCSQARHSVQFFVDSMQGMRTSAISRPQYCEAFSYLLEARPHETDSFLQAMMGLPSFLKEDAFQFTVKTSKLSQQRKHLQMDIFFSSFSPLMFRSLMVQNLDSDKYKDCLDWMNNKSCNRSVVFYMMFRLYMHCAWVGKKAHGNC